DGEPIISPSKDMVLGIYYLTMDQGPEPDVMRSFYSPEEVIYNREAGLVGLHDKINYLVETVFDDYGKRLPKPEKRLIRTTVGRVLFNEIIPEELRFKNETFGKGGIKDLIAEVFDNCGEAVCAVFGDSVKDIGFKYSMISGLTMAVSDITVPPEGARLKQEANRKVDIINRFYMRGYLTVEERDRLTIEIWRTTNDLVSKAVKAMFKPDADMAIMANSGASKGGFGPIGQLAGMRGLMADPSGRIITLPVKSNLKEGMDSLEYFIATHGARKGLADTALKTADAGYLTRRLVDVTHDLIITEEDCGTEDGIVMKRSDNVAKQKFADRLYGRRLAEDAVDPVTGEVYGRKGELVYHEGAKKIDKSGIQEIKVYSPITCKLKHGICRKCYGMDIAKNREIDMGAPVGTVGAQSIGEPGTQLTLRTFHSGGVAGGGDITSGLPRVEELFEARPEPKGLAVITKTAGTVSITEIDGVRGVLVTPDENSGEEVKQQTVTITDKDTVLISDGETVEKGTELIRRGKKTIKARFAGMVSVSCEEMTVTKDESEGKFYPVSAKAKFCDRIKDGVHVDPGDQLTEGALNPHEILKYKGREACQMYILQQVQNVYIPQGQSINVKHFELLIRKMFEKVLVKDPGDSNYISGDLVNGLDAAEVNKRLEAEGKRPAVCQEVLLGISNAALMSDSWLSAASFQHTVKVLTDSAIKGKTDPLYGIKENIILGKMIPAGTGFEKK
ncbi:MAG: DNA-directed RNA polymerase subunit beta', partial [Anaerolineaceae bacterium]|nr:DNA-directed RNA polymerase subunit beta' [Anaerolineaceae bacterium]